MTGPRATTVKIVSEYDQEIPQSQTADNPVAPRGRAAQPSVNLIRTIPREFRVVDFFAFISNCFIYQCCLLITLANSLDPDQVSQIFNLDRAQTV